MKIHFVAGSGSNILNFGALPLQFQQDPRFKGMAKVRTTRPPNKSGLARTAHSDQGMGLIGHGREMQIAAGKRRDFGCKAVRDFLANKFFDFSVNNGRTYPNSSYAQGQILCNPYGLESGQKAPSPGKDPLYWSGFRFFSEFPF